MTRLRCCSPRIKNIATITFVIGSTAGMAVYWLSIAIPALAG